MSVLHRGMGTRRGTWAHMGMGQGCGHRHRGTHRYRPSTHKETQTQDTWVQTRWHRARRWMHTQRHTWTQTHGHGPSVGRDMWSWMQCQCAQRQTGTHRDTQTAALCMDRWIHMLAHGDTGRNAAPLCTDRQTDTHMAQAGTRLRVAQPGWRHRECSVMGP